MSITEGEGIVLGLDLLVSNRFDLCQLNRTKCKNKLMVMFINKKRPVHEQLRVIFSGKLLYKDILHKRMIYMYYLQIFCQNVIKV